MGYWHWPVWHNLKKVINTRIIRKNWIMSGHSNKKEDWMQAKWRPMMGWMYMAVCAFDFMVAPVLWSLVQALAKGSIQTQWQPLTLQGAGLFHIAMGAVLGIAAYGRTQEKLNGANNGGLNFGSGAGTTYVPPGPQNTASVSNQPAAGFGGPANFGTDSDFNSSPTSWASPATDTTNDVSAPVSTSVIAVDAGQDAPPRRRRKIT
jgi:Holin of 3TMs, for gene-transfer release